MSLLKGLPATQLRTAVVSFEASESLGRPDRKALQAEFDSLGLTWIPLVLRERPSALALLQNLLKGTLSSLALARGRDPKLIHATSLMTGVIALEVKTTKGARLVLDMRGFWPEEAVELGLFRSMGFSYRLSKRCERALVRAADHIIVPTESAKAYLRDREARTRLESHPVPETPISVIPDCVDLCDFRPRQKDRELARKYDLDDKLVIGNIGAFDPRHMTSEMFRFAFHIKSHRTEMRFVYLTPDDPSALREIARATGLSDEDLLVLPVPRSELPSWLSLFRFGVFFLRPSYAAKAASYSQLGEFLGAGVPVVTNTGVGDVDRILATTKTGLLLPGLTDRDLATHAHVALDFLEGDGIPELIRQRCRATALKHFSLEEAVRRYVSIYTSLTSLETAEHSSLPAEVA